MKRYWLSKRAFRKGTFTPDWQYIAAQLSLDICGWNPTHSRAYVIPLIGVIRWYSAAKMPSCRKEAGNHGSPLVSFAIAQDCGQCDECKPKWPSRVYRPIL